MTPEPTVVKKTHGPAGPAAPDHAPHALPPEESLLQAQKLMDMGRLAGGVAHDFNNQLMAIIGHGEIVLRRLPTASPLREHVSEILNAVERAAALTRHLLAFSRRWPGQTEALDLNQVVQRVIRMLQRLIGEHVELATDLAPDLGRIEADPGLLEQLIVNLVVNARDAIGGVGRIRIETAGWGWEAASGAAVEGPFGQGRVALTVAGLPGGAVSPPSPAGAERAGLGPALVRGIVEQIGGHFVMTDEPGAGVTYTLELPVAGPDADAAGLGAGSGLPGGAETILVAEDDADVRELEVYILREQGYRVLEAASGVEALELLRSSPPTPPDLLLADMALPGMDGPQLAEQARRILPGLRVLYASGYVEDGGAIELDPRSPVKLLQKPFMPGELVRAVRGMLDAPSGPDAPAPVEPPSGGRP